MFGHAAAQELPPGVPNPLNPDGTLSDSFTFTTKAYQQAAFELILREANRVARDLKLPEDLPISESNLVRVFIAPFGYAYVTKNLGNITSSNYSYGAVRSNRFSE